MADDPRAGTAVSRLQLSEKDRARLRIIAIVTMLSALIGIGFVWLLSRITPFPLDWPEIETGARNGVLVGGSLTAFHLFYVQGQAGTWLRRRPLIQSFLLRDLLYTIVIVLAFLGSRLISVVLHPEVMTFEEYVGLSLLRDTVFSFVVFLAIAFVLEMRRAIGGRTLTNLLLGRYGRPVREERVFMLVDIKGSTALAAQLGDERAHGFIGSVFFDLDQPILAHGGEVHAYIGDAVIVTWTLAAGVADQRCLRCLAAVRQTLERQHQHYLRAFGVLPEARIILHAGPVVAGECGDAKLQIVFIGDVMNTLGRMEEFAKQQGHDALISANLLRCLAPDLPVEALPLGPVRLRGREQAVELFALPPAGMISEPRRRAVA
jgi:adenylate cyclase